MAFRPENPEALRGQYSAIVLKGNTYGLPRVHYTTTPLCNNDKMTTTLPSLPTELLHEILIDISDPRTYLRVGNVNRRLYSIVKSVYTTKCFVKHWFSRNCPPGNTIAPSIIEFIARFVSFHRTPPFRCKYEVSWAPPRKIISRPGQYQLQIGTVLKGNINPRAYRYNDEIDPSSDVLEFAALVEGYTELSHKWFEGYLQHLQKNSPSFVEGPGKDHTMMNMQLGIEEAVLASYLLDGWRAKLVPSGWVAKRYTKDCLEGRWLFDSSWFWKREVQSKRGTKSVPTFAGKCSCICTRTADNRPA
ncbi:hypothetical protein BJ508DRAFT_155216 [Ascobolus immersus RN42]|uniref:F-box domain-containing protein n=1 Tax=Ascobolus immersus RN42 TaxID=1160509 RepID=A0A3N4HZB1_ASCIM|nr:hypothetical protein BJ508DRAFT_155216 [Ascobolus immersus RN42]